MTSSFRSPRFLWPALGAISAALLWLVVWRAYPPYPKGHFDRAHSYSARWPDVPPFNLPGVDAPAFYDLQVLLWGIDVAAQGRDPYREPPPAGTPYWYNYPRIWLQLSALGLNLEATRPIGLALAAAFLACATLVARPASPRQYFWLLALLLCPPTLEALAYANNDLVIFVLLSLTALCWSSRRPGRGWPAVGLLGLAALLKLYPACALLAFIDGRRRTLVATCAVGAALLVFFAAHLGELRSVSSQTPRPHSRAIGSQVLSSRLLDGATRHPATLARFEQLGGMALWQRVLPPVTTASLLALLGGCAWQGFRHAHRHPTPAPPPGDPPALPRMAFRLGACVHLAAFAIGHNYMHREILLILVGPWLLATPNRRWLAWLILPITWLAAIPTGVGFLAVQLSTWALTAGLAYWLTRDLAQDLATSLRPARQAPA